jgi:hypothetical protein
VTRITLGELIEGLEQMAALPSIQPRHRALLRLAVKTLRGGYLDEPEHDPDAVTRRERIG